MIPKVFYNVLLVVLIFIVVALFSNYLGLYRNNKKFEIWVNKYKSFVVDNLAVNQNTADKIFSNVTYSKKIYNLQNHHISTKLSTSEYLSYVFDQNKSLSKDGAKFLNSHFSELNKITDKYGVSAYTLVSILGVGSYYGGNQGKNFTAVEALTNLAFNEDNETSKNNKFFLQQLNALMVLIKRGDVPMDVKSSWSGALGINQFMPLTYLYKSISAAGGKISTDLFNNFKNVFLSTANYLRELGWTNNQELAYAIKNNHSSATTHNIELYNNQSFSLDKWQSLGIDLQYYSKFEKRLSKNTMLTLFVTKGYPPILLTNNFNVIMKWNPSLNYALVVAYNSNNIQNYYYKNFSKKNHHHTKKNNDGNVSCFDKKEQKSSSDVCTLSKFWLNE